MFLSGKSPFWQEALRTEVSSKARLGKPARFHLIRAKYLSSTSVATQGQLKWILNVGPIFSTLTFA